MQNDRTFVVLLFQDGVCVCVLVNTQLQCTSAFSELKLGTLISQ